MTIRVIVVAVTRTMKKGKMYAMRDSTDSRKE